MRIINVTLTATDLDWIMSWYEFLHLRNENHIDDDRVYSILMSYLNTIEGVNDNEDN